MITAPTVFILGAGASEPYGLPVGLDLKRQIIWNLALDLSLDGENKRRELVEAGAALRDITSLAEDLPAAGLPSVDAFLERREDLIDVGKMAIAQALVPAEDEDRLIMLDVIAEFMNPSSDPPEDDRSARDWYSYLWREMDAPFGLLDKNAVSFITFNYDRSLERFLYGAIWAAHNHFRTFEECAAVVAQFNIVHVHGSLGRLPWQPGDAVARPYGGDLTAHTIQKAAASIQIVSETDAETAEFKQARNLIAAAERVVFLGFGYFRDNLDKLHIPRVYRGGPAPALVLGSAYGFESGERNRVSLALGVPRDRLGERGDDALLFLKRNADQVFG